MKLDAIISPGDKIDIQLIYQLEKQKLGEDIEVNTYKSQVYDFLSDTEIEIAMPSLEGKVVLFQVGLRCELVFYTLRGLYSCRTVVKSRYKKDNLLIVAVEIKSPLSKFQRREFFRVDCTIDFKYYNISEEVAALPDTNLLFEAINMPEYIGAGQMAITNDISGGGIRFTTDQVLEVDSYILIVIRLVSENLDNTFFLVGKIISSDAAVNISGKYINRAKFIFKDIKDRETIVRFVFDEERRIRKKENG